MESKYNYFKRDISWLSFNYRVLLEALDERLPLYERINFISIYSSNLEEFYKIRVADHKAVASGATESDEETVQSARELVEEINKEVTRQLDDRVRIYEQKILPALRKNHIIFYQDNHVEPFHQQFIKDFFREEIFPYLQPVPVSKDKIVSFLRDNRLYLAIRVYPKKEEKNKGEEPKENIEKYTGECINERNDGEGIKVGMEAARPNVTDLRHPLYFVMKQPYAKVPRFIELPSREKNHYLMFTEDIIKANLNLIFPGYDVDSSYCIKISRDADILIDDTASSADLVAQLKKKVKKRKIGDVCRFVYDRAMPSEFLDFLVDAFRIQRDELVPGDKHLNLEDLRHLPNPNKSLHSLEKPKPMKLTVLDEKESIFNYVAKKDLLLYYPYHSFEHFIHFLYEAVHNPETREIMVTQYRVAENSAVINTLIAAAQNGKKVTVFVELKARFDEENNLATAEMMQAAGIKIIYSIPGLKVHAKVALIRRRGLNGEKIPSYAYISTGNFNEKTATLYADCGLFTCRKEIVADLYNLFRTLQGKEDPKFTTLLVARFNLIPELNRLIDREISLADEGKQGRIILKMNALQDPTMIDRLYEASEHGVQIDLIVRGICCLIPGQSYSRNIRVTRIVDSFLEHARIWYFGNDGTPKVFMGSPDWMRRNLYRRIEAITPILAPDLRDSLIEMLNIQLADNQKACWVDDKLQNIFKKRTPGTPAVRAQYTFYDWLNKTNS
ncbi:polyphosphate kinase 1 [Bacteroides xylanisolvens]|uniref:polyphosphate kinase 1 n=1 Tax=Bacteroides xylanisolvens TaxID=371601 RepID=UPI0035197EA9